MNQYVIIGTGNSSANVIEDSLADLPTPRTFHVFAEKTNKEGICRVYDWLLDNKETFIAYYEQDAPAVILNAASSVVQTNQPHQDMEQVAIAGKMPVLYLYDDADDLNNTNYVFWLIDNGVRVLDLTQGLTPFIIVDDTPAKNDTKDSLPPMTRKEYEDMPDNTLAQHAKAQGLSTSAPREKLIETLLGESDTKEESGDISAVVVVVYGDDTTEVIKSTKKHVENLLKKLK